MAGLLWLAASAVAPMVPDLMRTAAGAAGKYTATFALNTALNKLDINLTKYTGAQAAGDVALHKALTEYAAIAKAVQLRLRMLVGPLSMCAGLLPSGGRSILSDCIDAAVQTVKTIENIADGVEAIETSNRSAESLTKAAKDLQATLTNLDALPSYLSFACSVAQQAAAGFAQGQASPALLVTATGALSCSRAFSSNDHSLSPVLQGATVALSAKQLSSIMRITRARPSGGRAAVSLEGASVFALRRRAASFASPQPSSQEAGAGVAGLYSPFSFVEQWREATLHLLLVAGQPADGAKDTKDTTPHSYVLLLVRSSDELENEAHNAEAAALERSDTVKGSGSAATTTTATPAAALAIPLSCVLSIERCSLADALAFSESDLEELDTSASEPFLAVELRAPPASPVPSVLGCTVGCWDRAEDQKTAWIGLHASAVASPESHGSDSDSDSDDDEGSDDGGSQDDSEAALTNKLSALSIAPKEAACVSGRAANVPLLLHALQLARLGGATPAAEGLPSAATGGAAATGGPAIGPAGVAHGAAVSDEALSALFAQSAEGRAGRITASRARLEAALRSASVRKSAHAAHAASADASSQLELAGTPTRQPDFSAH